MRVNKKKVLISAMVLIAGMQLIRPAKNLSAGASPNDMNTKYPIPADVQTILKRSCYDCHSNNTNYPWYYEVEPMGWGMAWHTNDGKKHFNFDEFASYTPKRARHKLEELVKEVQEGEMPLSSYLWIHQDAKLTPEEVRKITNWADSLRAAIPEM